MSERKLHITTKSAEQAFALVEKLDWAVLRIQCEDGSEYAARVWDWNIAGVGPGDDSCKVTLNCRGLKND